MCKPTWKGAKKGLGYRQQPSSRRRHKRAMLLQTQGACTGVTSSTGSSCRRTWPGPVSACPSAHWPRVLAHRQGTQALPQRWVADGCQGRWAAVCNVGGQAAGALKGLLLEEPGAALHAQLAQLLACGAARPGSASGRLQAESRAGQGRSGQVRSGQGCLHLAQCTCKSGVKLWWHVEACSVNTGTTGATSWTPGTTLNQAEFERLTRISTFLFAPQECLQRIC